MSDARRTETTSCKQCGQRFVLNYPARFGQAGLLTDLIDCLQRVARCPFCNAAWVDDPDLRLSSLLIITSRRGPPPASLN
jgi:predicted Zn-ribbon and HTH transcriptional regulator